MDLGSGLTAEKVAVGFGTVCAILDDGDSETGHSLKCWGKGDSGALGLGDAVTRGDNQYEMGNYLPAVNLGLSLSPVDVSRGRELRMLHSQQQHGKVLGIWDRRSNRAREERCDGGRIRRDGR